mmetsp:Transcript_72619/g.151590  ORF Transcript_72619/g.151590 Transcript_72619/m.151590 type:complete len:337 (-) Transcript_72619:55-1065(-)
MAEAKAADEGLLEIVQQCKASLGKVGAPAEEQLTALEELKKRGELPTKILSDTMIGKIVNTLSKSAPDEKVKNAAKDLVAEWRQAHRKRKGGALEGQSPLKRAVSTSSNFLGSETPLSQVSTDFTAESAPPSSLSRTDSLLSLGGESVDAAVVPKEGEIEAYRLKVRQKLLEAMGQAEEVESKDGKDGEGAANMRDPASLAVEIDEALHKALKKKEEYLAQARSIIYNLKDKRNATFRFKVMVGFYKPSDVPTLSAEDMASDEKNAERAKQRKYAMEEIQTDWALKNGQQPITGMFTCGKCKGVRTTYFQMQTRSSDEPMTTFVTCLTCNNRWKFC